jgi:hypothetical protein
MPRIPIVEIAVLGEFTKSGNFPEFGNLMAPIVDFGKAGETLQPFPDEADVSNRLKGGDSTGFKVKGKTFLKISNSKTLYGIHNSILQHA